jgi:hypothetical protein
MAEAARQANPSFVEAITVVSNKEPREEQSLLGGLVSLVYYESILSDTVRATVTFADTGANANSTTKNVSVVEGLPIVGQEKVKLKFKDNNDVKLGDKPEMYLYVNKVSPLSDDSRKTLMQLDLVSKEFILNEKTRITKRYDGNISDNVKQLLTDTNSIGLKTEKDLDLEQTSNNFNFIGNNKKPFYVINWLSRKAISANNQKKGVTAGYFFFETSEGFHFKSIDSLFAQKQKKSIIFNDTPGIPQGYDSKALTYSKDNLVNAQDKLKMGAFSTRTILFDPFTTYYEVVTPNAERNEDELKLAGKNLPVLNPEFNQDQTNKEFSRTTYYLLDKGTLATGNTEQQLEKKDQENFEYKQILNQSIMRFNQFFSSKATITIEGDFSLHAGDMIYLDVPQLEKERSKNVSRENSGLYIIAELTHLVDTNGTFTRLNLVRDSFGRTGKPSQESIVQ